MSIFCAVNNKTFLKDMKFFISCVVVFIVFCSFKSIFALSLKGNDRLNNSEEQEETDYNEIFETIPEECKKTIF